MRVGVLGTGAIAHKHLEAYRRIGYRVTACTNRTREKGVRFAGATGAEFVETPGELCAHPEVDFVDVATPPSYRLDAVRLAARHGKHVLVQKPMALDLETAAAMIAAAREGGVRLGVVSQHRFDEPVIFLRRALAEGRLGRILEADAYVKWYRDDAYYARPGRGTWAGDGGGALISQAIHQVDLLLHLAGPVEETFGLWTLGAAHAIESEDLLTAVVRYASGAKGVIQAATALWPGYPERVEIHGTRGTAIITGDQLTTWDLRNDGGEAVPVRSAAASGASDPMAISTAPFERQFREFGEACRAGREPACSGEDGYRALELVRAIYRSCSEGRPVRIPECTDPRRD